MKVSEVWETREVETYLSDRGLLKQYKKAKQYILLGLFDTATLRKRQPKSAGVWYFRINKKFRALSYLDGDILKVFHIDNHQ